MGLCKEDVTVCIEPHEDDVRVRNIQAPSPSRELQLFRLGELLSEEFDLSRVTVLELDHCDISQIPDQVRKLNLKRLVLTHNKLTEVPSCLYSSLASVELLDLSHNLIKEFQVEPACSSTIVQLKLADNKIRTFPIWVLTAPCPNLQEVDYSGNRLVKLNTERHLSIKKLEMRNSQLMDVDFAFLKKIKTLEFLDVGNDKSRDNENRFKDISVLFVSVKWTNLLTLKLNNLMLSIIPKGIFWIYSLIELHLVNCDLSWVPEEIEFLPNLERLDVSENAICSLPKALTSLPKLSIVKASFNNISKVDEFANDLEILDLYHNQLENFIPFERIRSIDLEQNCFDTSLHSFSENYKAKRDHFRGLFDFVRFDGPMDLREEPYPFDDDHKSFSDDENSVSHFYDITLENECWDEEKSSVVSSQRNPDVTPSDDEWNGKEDIKIKKKAKLCSAVYDQNEDWIFCDAEEQ